MSNTVRSRYLYSAPLLAWLVSGNIPVLALPDPTQPPASILAPVATSKANDSGLQSVIISPVRRAAIINGKTVELGETIEGAKLVKVKEGYVVLRGAEGEKVLSLFGGVKLELKTAATDKSHGNAANRDANGRSVKNK